MNDVLISLINQSRNVCNLAEGNINRMMVTPDATELDVQLLWAIKHLLRLQEIRNSILALRDESPAPPLGGCCPTR